MDLLASIPRRDATQTLRIISFNIQHGTPAEGWTKELGRMSHRGFRPGAGEVASTLGLALAQLRRLDPDILLLQEVDKKQARSGGTHQAEAIASGLGMRHWRVGAAFAGHAAGLRRRPLSRALRFERGYGLAICSRFPLVGLETIALPRMPRTGKRPCAQLWRTRRVLMVARVQTPWGPVAIGNTHLETNREAAGDQAVLSWEKVCELDAGTAILAGDFNLSPEQVAAAFRRERPEGGLPRTSASALAFPASDPRHRIDQLYAEGWRLEREPEAIRLAISDHCAAVFDLVPAPTATRPVEEGLY